MSARPLFGPRGDEARWLDALPDLEFLLKNTTPVPGEVGACLESWGNVLRALGLSRDEVDALLDRAADRWPR